MKALFCATLLVALLASDALAGPRGRARRAARGGDAGFVDPGVSVLWTPGQAVPDTVATPLQTTLPPGVYHGSAEKLPRGDFYVDRYHLHGGLFAPDAPTAHHATAIKPAVPELVPFEEQAQKLKEGWTFVDVAPVFYAAPSACASGSCGTSSRGFFGRRR